jgi:hypothetical protein
MEAQPTSNIFTLPAVANSSSSSLMDAVVGGSKSTFAPPFTLASLREEGEGQPRKKEEVKELEAKLQKR